MGVLQTWKEQKRRKKWQTKRNGYIGLTALPACLVKYLLST